MQNVTKLIMLNALMQDISEGFCEAIMPRSQNCGYYQLGYLKTHKDIIEQAHNNLMSMTNLKLL